MSEVMNVGVMNVGQSLQSMTVVVLDYCMSCIGQLVMCNYVI